MYFSLVSLATRVPEIAEVKQKNLQEAFSSTILYNCRDLIVTYDCYSESVLRYFVWCLFFLRKKIRRLDHTHTPWRATSTQSMEYWCNICVAELKCESRDLCTYLNCIRRQCTRKQNVNTQIPSMTTCQQHAHVLMQKKSRITNQNSQICLPSHLHFVFFMLLTSILPNSCSGLCKYAYAQYKNSY